MRIIYECEMCHNRSSDFARIIECEAQKRVYFPVGSKVEFFFNSRSQGIWLLARVDGVSFEMQTHTPSYHLVMPVSVAKRGFAHFNESPNLDDDQIWEVTFVPEKYVRQSEQA